MTVRRTFAGIQFVYVNDGYAHPGDNLSHWQSVDGTRLFCQRAFRTRLSDHWEATSPSGHRASGWSAEDALRNAGIGRAAAGGAS